MFRRLTGSVPDRWLFNYAHAVVEKRVVRSRHPRLFLALLLWHSVAAALRWNRAVTPTMRSMLAAWGRMLFARPVEA
jgi:hypothetical protein